MLIIDCDGKTADVDEDIILGLLGGKSMMSGRFVDTYGCANCLQMSLCGKTCPVFKNGECPIEDEIIANEE